MLQLRRIACVAEFIEKVVYDRLYSTFLLFVFTYEN